MPRCPDRAGWLWCPAVRGVWAVCVLSAACSLSKPIPQARVRRGPAWTAPPSIVLALPAECISAQGDACTDAHRAAVDSAARMALEFVGYTLVDSQTVNVRLGERRELTRQTGAYGATTEQHEVEVKRVTWEEATLEERRAVIGELEADGILASAITMTMPDLVGDRTIEVRLTLSRAGDERVVWVSRCAVETGDGDLSTEQAIEHATRCALESATLVE